MRRLHGTVVVVAFVAAVAAGACHARNPAGGAEADRPATAPANAEIVPMPSATATASPDPTSSEAPVPGATPAPTPTASDDVTTPDTTASPIPVALPDLGELERLLGQIDAQLAEDAAAGSQEEGMP